MKRYVIALITLSCACPARAQEPAHRADDFVDRIGVATHWGYLDTPYGTAYEKTKELLGASGIRHVRDGAEPRLAELYAAHGIRATVLFNPGDTAAVIRRVKELGPALDMVEGPNEVDIFPQSAAYKGKGFPDGPRQWMADLHAALISDPATRNVKLIAPSLGRAGTNEQLAPMTSFDCCVMHSYAGGQMPSASLTSDINNNITGAYAILGRPADLKPIVVTESGYHTALGSSVVIAGAQPGVSERAHAKYMLRHFAEYFNAGVVRTITYEFVDEFPDYDTDQRTATNAEACFGLVKHDMKPKPAYQALRRLLALVGEAKWDAAAKRWNLPDPGFRPRALAFTLSGVTASVHHTLLQKADGDFYLLLWQELPSFDTRAARDTENADAPVTLRLAEPARLIEVYRPGQRDAPVAAISGPPREVALQVPDEVIVVRIRCLATPAGSAPTAPREVIARTTASTSSLLWSAPASGKPAAYFVWRQGRLIATTKEPRLDDAKLLPGAGYTYEVACCDAAGRVSDRASIVARTANDLPDLVVADFSFASPPEPGKPVRFTATIENRGKAPTPAGVVHGVAFSVDGKVVCWSDSFTGPLAPGEKRTLTTNGGPDGTGAWVAAPGDHTIVAVVDDVQRIPESTKSNNSLEKKVTIK